MKLVVCVRHYDYFGGDKRYHKTYSNLLEGWKEFKENRSYDFNYNDAFRTTTCYVRHDYTVELKRQRPHARSLYEWRKMCEKLEAQKFRDEHMEFIKPEWLIFDTEFDIEDEDIII